MIVANWSRVPLFSKNEDLATTYYTNADKRLLHAMSYAVKTWRMQGNLYKFGSGGTPGSPSPEAVPFNHVLSLWGYPYGVSTIEQVDTENKVYQLETFSAYSYDPTGAIPSAYARMFFESNLNIADYPGDYTLNSHKVRIVGGVIDSTAYGISGADGNNIPAFPYVITVPVTLLGKTFNTRFIYPNITSGSTTLPPPSLTITAEEYWEYGGTFDPDTGFPPP